MDELVEGLLAAARHNAHDCEEPADRIEAKAAVRIKTLEAWANGPNGVKWYTDRYAEQQARIESLTAQLAEAHRKGFEEGREAAAKWRLPRLTDKMMRAAAKAHYGSDNIDGIDMTAADMNYTFRAFMQRIWPAIRKAGDGVP